MTPTNRSINLSLIFFTGFDVSMSVMVVLHRLGQCMAS